MAQLCSTQFLSQLAVRVTDGTLPPQTNMKGDADTLLTGKHVLLVEDQTLIALDTESLLRELGAATVETFTNAEAALAWLASASPDVAVLDINLGGSSSFSVAEALQQRGAPFVFTTGYSEGFDVPETYRPVPVARKPYTRESLAQVLEDCLAERRAAGT